MENLHADEPNRDLPLSPRWIFKDDSLQRLLPHLPGTDRRAVTAGLMNAICTQSVLERLGANRRISYSRRKEWYTHCNYLPGHRVVVSAVDALEAAGLIETWIAPSGWPTGCQSRLRATGELLDIVCGIDDINNVQFAQRRGLWRPVELRDPNGTVIPYPDTERTRRMARNVERINEPLKACVIAIGDTQPNGQLLRIGQQYVNTAANETKRIFNCDLKNGGRFYGPWWQQLPKSIRELLCIDGEPVVEIDHSYLHPRLLYACLDITLSEDPYEIDGWERPIVKRAFNILVNALTPQSALGAIAARLEDTPDGQWPSASARQTARELIFAIKSRHERLADADLFHSGAGRWLMLVDSNMCEKVQLDLTKQGIVALPVHDSHIVQERHASALSKAMGDAFGQAGNHLKMAA